MEAVSGVSSVRFGDLAQKVGPEPRYRPRPTIIMFAGAFLVLAGGALLGIAVSSE